jgi:hypothetical protein
MENKSLDPKQTGGQSNTALYLLIGVPLVLFVFILLREAGIL